MTTVLPNYCQKHSKTVQKPAKKGIFRVLAKNGRKAYKKQNPRRKTGILNGAQYRD